MRLSDFVAIIWEMLVTLVVVLWHLFDSIALFAIGGFFLVAAVRVLTRIFVEYAKKRPWTAAAAGSVLSLLIVSLYLPHIGYFDDPHEVWGLPEHFTPFFEACMKGDVNGTPTEEEFQCLLEMAEGYQ